MNAEQIEACARAAHEANRALCIFQGDMTQKTWDEAEEWQRESARRGVTVALSGEGPRAQHEAWRADKLADGWRYGAVKDAIAKTHPCLLDYDALPPQQQVKDAVYLAVVRAMAEAVNVK